ncbi:MAG: hypothetical protein ACRD36_07280, partial [Candidatus Acidiferrum sp.]
PKPSWKDSKRFDPGKRMGRKPEGPPARAGGLFLFVDFDVNLPDLVNAATVNPFQRIFRAEFRQTS